MLGISIDDKKAVDDLSDSVVVLVGENYYFLELESIVNEKSMIGIIPLSTGDEIWISGSEAKDYFNKGILRRLEIYEKAYCLLLGSLVTDVDNVFIFNINKGIE